MPNANYLAGRRFEYLVKKDFENEGYIVLRTAGSHGFFDLVIIHKQGPTYLCQCKVVKTITQANNLTEKWRDEPPLQANYHNQLLAIKIKGDKGYRKVWA